jgi:hypothetical protein
MTWDTIVDSVCAKIHDGHAQDKELRAIWREIQRAQESAAPVALIDPARPGPAAPPPP